MPDLLQRVEVSKPVLLAGDGKAPTQADLRDLNPLHDAAGMWVRDVGDRWTSQRQLLWVLVVY